MTAAKTSHTHPLRVEFVTTPWGRLGMTFAPGKYQPSASVGYWARDLETDMKRLRVVYRTDVLVSVIEVHELRELKIAGLAAMAGRFGIRWIHVPVRDGSVPETDDAWNSAIRSIRGCLREGQTIVIHCRGGLGRTGMLAASVLTTYGTPPSEAIAAVRTARPGTIENSTQEAFVHRSSDKWRESFSDRVRGCLLGGAVGDALGAAVEFMTLADIRAEHGPKGVRELRPAYGRVGAITDDTQMTLFTAEGLLRAIVRARDKGICHPPSVVEFAYFRWLWTQGDPVPRELEGTRESWLFDDPRLHAQRAPGNTCLSALRQAVHARVRHTAFAHPRNNSKGCGGVMRVAPVGLVGEDPWRLGKECAALTHGHPAGYESAGLFAEIVAEVIDDVPLSTACHRVWQRRKDECCPDLQHAIERAFALLHEGGPPTPERVEALGGGWVGEEALAIALYCALACPDIESALSLAVTHSGDSDSTGAIPGNLLGAEQGLVRLPVTWVEPLELRDTIERLSDAITRYRLDDAVDSREYPGC